MIDYEYSKEERLCPILPGLYSNFDADVAYSVVRGRKPRVIVDCAPREGKTTSTIVSALLKNIEEDPHEVSYYLFEKDVGFLQAMKTFLEPYVDKINFVFQSNIIGEVELPENIDLIFIDANHDYILAQYLQDTLFPRLACKSLVHYHDTYYNAYGRGWDDVVFSGCPQSHPDIVDSSVLRGLYPEIFEKYFLGEPINTFEGDVVANFANRNPSVKFLSTIELARELNPPACNFPNCSLWFFVSGALNLD